MTVVVALVNHILVATDFSEHSRRALDYAVAMAEQFDADLLITHIYFPPVLAVPDAIVPLTAGDLQALLARLEAGLRDAAAVATRQGATRVETALVEGDPWHEIVRLARERGCDLIVVGTHGRGAVGHFFLGSVAEKVVRKAGCPVLVVGTPSP